MITGVLRTSRKNHVDRDRQSPHDVAYRDLEALDFGRLLRHFSALGDVGGGASEGFGHGFDTD